MTRLARMGRHWLAHLKPARVLLPETALAQIEAEVRTAELTHAGEIRVAVETSLSFGQLWQGLSARERALQVFAALGVWDTAHNNGVLIYVLLADRAVEFGLREAEHVGRAGRPESRAGEPRPRALADEHTW